MTIIVDFSALENGYRAYKVLVKNAMQDAANKAEEFRAAEAASQGVNADRILGLFHDSRRALEALDTIAALPGIAQFARNVEQDQNYDPVTQYSAFKAAVEAVKDAIKNNFPVDGEGYLLEKQWAPDDTYTFRQFTGNQLTALANLLDAVVAIRKIAE